MFTHAFLKIKKNQEASTSHDLFNASHIHGHFFVVDFCPDSLKEAISWHFADFSVYNGDICVARYRLPSEEQVQALGSLLLKSSEHILCPAVSHLSVIFKRLV